jgi:hypothetical protein
MASGPKSRTSARQPPTPSSTQRQLFEQAARELGLDLDEEKLKEALRKAVLKDEKGDKPKGAD